MKMRQETSFLLYGYWVIFYKEYSVFKVYKVKHFSMC